MTFQRIPKDELSGRSRFYIFLTSKDDVSPKSNYGLYGWELLKVGGERITQKFEYCIRPNIARIESNKNVIPVFPLGENLDNYSGDSRPKISISFDVSKDFSYRVQGLQKFHYFWGKDERDEVYYERPVGLGLTLKLFLKDLLRDTKLVVNDVFFRYVRVKLDSVYPPGVHLADILISNLLYRGYAPVHCAAISSPAGEGMLLFAPPDTGKTLTTFAALRKGFHYLAEDIAFVDSEHVYSNPHTATFLHNEEFASQYVRTTTDPISSIIKKVPLLSSYASTPAVSVSSMAKDFQIDEEAPIRRIIILDRGKKHIERISKEEAVRRILIINRNEFSYHKNSLLFAYSYFNPSFNLNKMMKIEQEIIDTMASRADCFLAKTSDAREYFHLIAGLQ